MFYASASLPGTVYLTPVGVCIVSHILLSGVVRRDSTLQTRSTPFCNVCPLLAWLTTFVCAFHKNSEDQRLEFPIVIHSAKCDQTDKTTYYIVFFVLLSGTMFPASVLHFFIFDIRIRIK